MGRLWLLGVSCIMMGMPLALGKLLWEEQHRYDNSCKGCVDKRAGVMIGG
jgi:hypothetical protein